jgi:hypothetical protein
VYTELVCEMLAFAEEKEFLAKGRVIEVGQSQWKTSLNRYMKARVPGFMLAQSSTEMFSRLNVDDYTAYPSDKDISANTTSPVVCAFSYIDSKIDVISAWTKIHDLTETNGYMIIAAPISTTARVSSVTVNQVVSIARSNKYDVPYLVIGTSKCEFRTKIDSTEKFGLTKLREILYKFRETTDLHISVILKKKHDEVFKY